LTRVDRNQKKYEYGLWAYWTFEEPEPTTIYDQSGNQRDGTGANLTRVQGISGYAYWFNGENSGVKLPSDIAVLPDVPLSVALWFYSPEYPDHSMYMLYKNQEYRISTPFRALYVWGPSLGVYQSEYELAFFVSAASGDIFGISTDAVYGKWTFVVGTWDGEIVRLYVNGELKAEDTYSGNLYQQAWPLRIGRSEGGYYFYGIIDEVKIYSKALTPEEVKRMYMQYRMTKQYPYKVYAYET